MSAVIMGTAGHIDHGKTSLIRALTGVDLDRLEEEKRRGITIELGFVSLDLGDGLKVGVVDVPGHERFVKTMVAGAQGMDMVMLVVAADEGVMPQTEEHLDICGLLNVRFGLTALAKIDRADDETRMLAVDEVKELARGTFLEGAPIVPCSASSGEGIEALRRAIAELARSIPPRPETGIFRLPIDRSFTIKGFGTVVTGSVSAGSLKKGDRVEIIPSGRRAVVREMEVHGERVERASAGQRLAVNLAGVERGGAGRGMWLTRPGALMAARSADVWLQSLDSAAPLEHGTEILFHAGTAHLLAEVDLLDRKSLPQGAEGPARLHLKSSAAFCAGDRFVLRSFARKKTVAGGVVLDPLPGERFVHRGKAGKKAAVPFLAELQKADRNDYVMSLVAASGAPGVIRARLGQRAPFPPDEVKSAVGALIKKGRVIAVPGRDERLLAKESLESMGRDMEQKLSHFHSNHPMEAGMTKGALRNLFPGRIPNSIFMAALQALLDAGKVKSEGDSISLKIHVARASEKDDKKVNEIDKALKSGGFTPPSPAQLAQSLGIDNKNAINLLKYMVESGRAKRVSKALFYHPEALGQIEELLRKFIGKNGSITPGEFKELTNASRKFAIALLEYFDRQRVTIRKGDKRILREG